MKKTAKGGQKKQSISGQRKFSVKKGKCSDLDEKLATEFAKQHPPQFVKAVLSAPSDKTNKRKRKQKKQTASAQTKVDRVEQEVGQHVPPEMFRGLILEPHPKLASTKDLEGYEEARVSAENAMRKIFASTDAAQAGFKSETPILDVFFYKVRTGLISSDSLEIALARQYAQHIGKVDWFSKRLPAELHNATKRVAGAHQFNDFRAMIATHWLRFGLWLMSDDLIARVLPKPFAGCTRQAITRAVKELGLLKHPETARAPVVKDLRERGVFVFREGYSPKA